MIEESDNKSIEETGKISNNKSTKKLTKELINESDNESNKEPDNESDNESIEGECIEDLKEPFNLNNKSTTN